MFPVVIGCHSRRSRLFTIAIGILVGCSAVAHACNVPVFRFALERWRPDPYRMVLFHHGPLSDVDRALISPFEEPPDKFAANLLFRAIDVNGLDAGQDRDFLASQDNPQLPWLVMRYPEHLHIEAPVWRGAIDRNTLARLSDSPVRQELVKRLVDGQTAVWLFLDSGQPEKDDSAAALLENELRKQEQELKLPELTDSPDDALLASTPLRVAFSLLRVSRGDAAEQALIEMLLHSESDLAGRSDPLVFPVFGRGRALFPLVGAGITAENIRDSASFLVGPCSCQVKELNPGFDLLLAADWDSLLSQEGIALTAVASQERAPPGDPVLVPIPSGLRPPPTSATATTAPAAVVNQAEGTATVTVHTGLNAAGITLVSMLVIAGVIVATLLMLRR